MTEIAEKLRSELQTLPVFDRAELAHFLIQSLGDAGEEQGSEHEWNAELARRVEEIHQGQDQGEPAEEVFRSLRAKDTPPDLK